MENNELYISSDIMDKYSRLSDENTTKLDNTKNTNDNGFGSVSSLGLYNKGFNKIGTRLGTIINTIKNTNNINIAYINKFKSLEEEGIELAQDLVVPKIDNTKSISLINQYANIKINKEDGKSVNDGTSTIVNNSLTDNYNVDSDTLESITKVSQDEVIELTDNNSSNKETLESINTSDKVFNIELDEYEETKNEILSTINNKINSFDVIFNDIDLEEVDLTQIDKETIDNITLLNDYINSNKVELFDFEEVSK